MTVRGRAPGGLVWELGAGARRRAFTLRGEGPPLAGEAPRAHA